MKQLPANNSPLRAGLKQRAALLGACALLAVASQAGAGAPPQCVPTPIDPSIAAGPALSGQLEILSWNIQKASNTGWDTDFFSLAGGVDIAFIQEASLQAGIPSVLANPLHEAFTAGYTTSEQETGVMTLSSSAASMHCHFTRLEPWLGTPKATIATKFPLAGREDTLLAINLHAVNFSLALTSYRQQFRDLATLLTSHQGPIIMAGDFNTWNPARQLLVDRFVSGFGLEPVSFSPDLRSTAFGQALDHVYTRGLLTQSAEVIPVASSDHNPLRLRLALH